MSMQYKTSRFYVRVLSTLQLYFNKFDDAKMIASWFVFLLATCVAFFILFEQTAASGSITQANGNTRTSFYGNANIDKKNIVSYKILVNKFLGTDEKFLAQPLVYNGLVTAISMSNTLYQLDSTNSAITRKRKLAIPFNITRHLPDCAETDFHNSAHGGQATPVIWRNTLFVLVKTYKPGTQGLSNSIYQLHAIFATFNVVYKTSGFPVIIGGTYNGVHFDPSIHQQRTGLLVQDDTLFFSFASYCDQFSFRGCIFSYDPSTGSWYICSRNCIRAHGRHTQIPEWDYLQAMQVLSLGSLETDSATISIHPHQVPWRTNIRFQIR